MNMKTKIKCPLGNRISSEKFSREILKNEKWEIETPTQN
ncbi:hypothetical protein SIPHO067v1_p0063 [Vibrio phage 51E28.1]|nr:hypothetical protein SIPHO068v1_p0036 [Vibrio phage 51E28.4]QZI92903.1 hypothetical protein SIPHO067v1_p0063 [Vibrio phage 51E28.1]